MKFSTLIQNLKKKLFGKEPRQPDTQPIQPFPLAKDSVPGISDSITVPPTTRQPYFIQIGFDFGTSYSKCVCRDMMTDRAWVHIPNKCAGQELPFLIPSTLLLKNRGIGSVDNPEYHYPENGLYHLKHALVKIALRQWDDPVLAPYRSAVGSAGSEKLRGFVETCAVYFLAGALGEVRAQIRRRLPEFGSLPEDYMAVNLAVPVADAERPEVNELYQQILCEAWELADKLAGYPSMHFNELESLRKENHEHRAPPSGEACFIYPEVSANVQGFVRSRVSSEGIYLFSDTGASTVDQGIFIFMRRNEGEYLTYLHGTVLPLGSSQIEHKAAMNSGKMDWQSLEKWREIKEQGGPAPELRKAREWIAERLTRGTEATLAFAKNKLFVKDQLNDTRVIFGGGGHCEYPYKVAVMNPFSGQLFRQSISPDVVSLPPPRDLEIKDSETRWMRRLSVAYGLSFEKSELAGFTYPKDVATPKPEEIWQPRKKIPDPPSKDQC